jgi:hypothetical protein
MNLDFIEHPFRSQIGSVLVNKKPAPEVEQALFVTGA